MARSPSHRLGQIVGDELEAALREPLEEIVKEFGLYLDYTHSRAARNGRKRVVWGDLLDNSHVLDYVIEDGGSEAVRGKPRAFIEVAWRRYTKHSKNKAQEIQGAIAPIKEAYREHCPFLGAVLAGVYTEPALNQLQSHGFNYIYCSYETLVQAFAAEQADISYNESTSTAELQRKVDALEGISQGQRDGIAAEIRDRHSDQFKRFLDILRSSLGRRIESVAVLPLSGTRHHFEAIQDAVRYISNHDTSAASSKFVRYELTVRYSNGDRVCGTFHDGNDAIKFLDSCVNPGVAETGR